MCVTTCPTLLPASGTAEIRRRDLLSRRYTLLTTIRYRATHKRAGSIFESSQPGEQWSCAKCRRAAAACVCVSVDTGRLLSAATSARQQTIDIRGGRRARRRSAQRASGLCPLRLHAPCCRSVSG